MTAGISRQFRESAKGKIRAKKFARQTEHKLPSVQHYFYEKVLSLQRECSVNLDIGDVATFVSARLGVHDCLRMRIQPLPS
jgi:hypothetical protein